MENIDPRTKKQDYLKDAVLSQGFDGNEFSNFLNSKREGGTDIDNWTYQELV